MVMLSHISLWDEVVLRQTVKILMCWLSSSGYSMYVKLYV